MKNFTQFLKTKVKLLFEQFKSELFYKLSILGLSNGYNVLHAKVNLTGISLNPKNNMQNKAKSLNATFKIVLIVLSLVCTENILAQEFITTWDTTLPGSSDVNSIRIPAVGTYDVDLGNDGSYELLDQTGTITIDVTSHGYANGVIQVTMRNAISAAGNLQRIVFNNGGDRQKILDINQWGSSIAWTSMSQAYYGCTNLDITATDAPDLSGVTSMNEMFRGCTSLIGTPAFNTWNVSNVTSMFRMFIFASAFNQDMGNWDVSNVTSFSEMFRDTPAFQGINLNGWNNRFNASNISMFGMFRGANTLTGDISGWVTTNVTSMAEMFRGNTTFNQDIGNWDVSSVTSFRYMFLDAAAFQGTNLQLWNSRFNGTNISMFGMFRNADALTGDITGWVTTNVINMAEMFWDNGPFNQAIGNWDVSNVTTMFRMFTNTSIFNQDLGNWNVSSVTNFTEMFLNAAAFQGTNMQLWNNRFNASPISMFGMFRNANAFNSDITSWVTTNVTNMARMFESNGVFNREIGNWDVSNVTTMNRMFSGATVFNADLGNWMPTSCTDFNFMFNSALAFQGTNMQLWNNRFNASPISMFGMFRNADAFNSDI
ncbi:BspA family leucine-rich repeat surface protein, partial [Aquimarina sp. 2201CG14-23]|uniref:BspA family leucine-rich repeat surface protein n=1 Tax=Aquimarina mycalae TaxID=3040073 RepID=UPI002478015A